MGALKAELAAAKRAEGSGGTPGRTSEMMNMQRQILEKMPGLGSGMGGDHGGEVASLRHQLEQSRNDAQDARSMVQPAFPWCFFVTIDSGTAASAAGRNMDVLSDVMGVGWVGFLALYDVSGAAAVLGTGQRELG